MSGLLSGDRVALRPTEPTDVGRLREIRATPEVAKWWGPLEEDFPLDDEPAATRFTALVDGEVAGMLQFQEEPEPDYRSADIDIFLDPPHHGRGLGTDAVTTLVRHLLEGRGHHRVTISAAIENAVAIRCYEKAGFRRVGTLEAAARDPWTGEWHDELLMELVVRTGQTLRTSRRNPVQGRARSRGGSAR